LQGLELVERIKNIIERFSMVYRGVRVGKFRLWRRRSYRVSSLGKRALA
jgi:hypothetical protein